MMQLSHQTKQECSVDRETRVVSLSQRAVCRELGLGHDTIHKLKKRWLNADEFPCESLERLWALGFESADEITDEMFSCLLSYYAFDTQRPSPQAKILARSAITLGVRTWLHWQLGYDLNSFIPRPEFRPNDPTVAEKVRAGRYEHHGRTNPIRSNDAIESVLQDMGIEYYRDIRLLDYDGIQNSKLVLDFYLPNEKSQHGGLALKGYHQNSSGSGQWKLPGYLDEMQYKYPMPSVLVLSGDYFTELDTSTSNGRQGMRWLDYVRSHRVDCCKVLCAANQNLDMLASYIRGMIDNSRIDAQLATFDAYNRRESLLLPSQL